MVTHAFFKALLFLGSGSVIHGMHHEQDMRKMGALRKLMPVTAITFIVGWLAIAGVPPFSGFWSKDEILLFAAAKSPVLYAFGLLTAILTAYYMTRQVIMVFFGKANWHDAHDEHGAHGDFTPHESPKVMLAPLVILAGLAAVGGIIQLPSMFGIPKDWTHKLEHWLEPAMEDVSIKSTSAYDNKQLLAIVAIVCAVAGIVGAIMIYAKHKAKPVEPQLLADGWNYDKGITAFMGGPGRKAFDGVAWLDANVIDGAVTGTGKVVQGAAGVARKAQSGNVRNYAGAVGVGVVLLLTWFVVIRGIL
jgi:NADH-quinone oxidoreductase subunit L